MRLKSSFISIFNWHNLRYFLGFGLALIGFIGVALFVHFNNQSTIDISIRDWAYQVRGSRYGFGYYFFRFVTELGFVYFLILFMICFCVATRFDLRSAILGFGTLVIYITNELVKMIFLRERPLESMQWMTEHSTSFPSGHSMTSIFFYTVMAYFVWHSVRPGKKTKYTLSILSIVAIFLVGLSRIMLGVHYFTDVIGGYLLGFSLAMLAILVFKVLDGCGFKFLSRFFVRSPKIEER